MWDLQLRLQQALCYDLSDLHAAQAELKPILVVPSSEWAVREQQTCCSCITLASSSKPGVQSVCLRSAALLPSLGIPIPVSWVCLCSAPPGLSCADAVAEMLPQTLAPQT